MNPRRLLFLVTADWYFCSHRLALALAARDAGYQVTVATQVARHGEVIRDHGLALEALEFPRSLAHPLRDLRLLATLPQLYRRVRPDVAHHVALKPVVYAAHASRLAQVPVTVNAIAGLGHTFTSDRLAARAIRRGLSTPLRIALSGPGRWTIVQNPHDRALLVERRLCRPDAIRLIEGSGVDLSQFHPVPESEGPPVIVLPARLLWDKGVREFVEAARLLRGQGVAARMVLAGEPDRENPSAVPRNLLDGWVAEGVVEWWGWCEDMAAVLRGAHIVCLPSYREGLPKVLLEAAACGRPVVASRVSGCSEAVQDEVTGLLVPARDPMALARALRRLVDDPARRREMGRQGRSMAVKRFGIERVVEQTLDLYDEALALR